MQGRVAYALGYTGLGVASSRFGGEVMLDLLDGKRSRATQTDFVKERPLPFPPEPFRFVGIQTTTLVAGPRGSHRQAQRLAAHPRPDGPRLRQLARCDRPSDRRNDRTGIDSRTDDGRGRCGLAVGGRRAVGDRAQRTADDRYLQRASPSPGIPSALSGTVTAS